jgi:cell division septum initiation protein DivIVA
MDITPQFLKDLKLSDAFRGYNKDEVDELIERMGAAFGQLQARLRDALERAEHAESRAVVGGGRPESEETLRRTLVLAQRTADAAIAEANAEAAATIAAANERAARTIATADEHADRTVSDARAEAGRAVSEANEIASRTVRDAEERAARTVNGASERAQHLLADAESHAANLRAETDAEVRRIAEESRGPLMDQIRELERVRNFLRDDVDLLERHLHAQRERMRLQVAELARIVDEPSSLRIEAAPATSGVEASEVLSQPTFVAAPTPSTLTPPPAVSFAPPTASVPPAAFGAAAAGAGAAASAAAVQIATTGATEDAYADDAELDEDAEDAFDDDAYDDEFDDDDLDDDELDAELDDDELEGELDDEEFDDEEFDDEEFDDPNATRPIDVVWGSDRVGPYAETFETGRRGMVDPELEGGGDQFLAHLRRAVEDEDAGDDEDRAMTAFFDQQVDEAPRSRFGFRR